MKKISAIILALMVVFALASCGAETSDNTEETTPASASEIMDEIKNAGYFPEDYMTLGAENLIDYNLDIEASLIADCAVIMNTSGYQDELYIIKPVDDAAKEHIKSVFEDHIQYQMKQMENYSPEQYAILQKCNVIENAGYVALFISANTNEIANIFNAH